MSASSLAGVITAIAASITAIGGFILSITVLIPMLRTSKSTHNIVNQQRTDMQNYIRALTTELRKHGIDIPVDQSLPPDPGAELRKIQAIHVDRGV